MARFRNQHPDLNPDGSLKADADVPPAERDFNRRLSDPSDSAHFMAQAARDQAELPAEVQQYVGGRHYPGSPAEGYRAYQQDRAWALQEWGRLRGYSRVVTDKDVGNMSLQQYDELFDATGSPKDGVLLWRTSRSHVIDDGTNFRGARR